MTRIYEVNPIDTSVIWDRDANGRVYGLGGSGPWRTNTDIEPSTIPPEGIPEWNLYQAIEDPSQPPPYHTLERVDLMFEGAVHDEAARVRETRVYAQISLDSLKDIKEGELRSHMDVMLSNTANTDLHPAWWIVVNEAARTWHASVINFLHDRMKRILIDGEGIPYWARDVPVPVVNQNNDNRELVEVDEPTWSTIVKDIGVHDFAATDANAQVQSDIETNYNAGNWGNLAGIDVTDSGYGWPPVYLL